jgi:tryptophanyl-tRNA synthetase
MAADILAYKATHVPVGADQKQHLELARDIAGAFNTAVGRTYFPLPEPCILGNTTRVMSLRDGLAKMSKSDPSEASRIHLMDDVDTLTMKIRKAKTDSALIPATWAELEGRPEAQNLILILSALEAVSTQKILDDFVGQNFAPFKARLIDAVVATIAPIGESMRRLVMQDAAYLESCLNVGAAKAQAIAGQTLKEVHGLLGLG